VPLSDDKIRELLAKKNKPRSTGGRTGTGTKKIDPNDRSYLAWFALNHSMLDSETNERTHCSNPDCIDPRPKEHGQIVVEVKGQKMCRYCFIEGWLLENPAQEKITTT